MCLQLYEIPDEYIIISYPGLELPRIVFLLLFYIHVTCDLYTHELHMVRACF